MKARTLKIETTGDFWRGKTAPKIRLVGQWLERAGFKPGHRVEVSLDQPGTLTLRFLEQSNALHDESHPGQAGGVQESQSGTEVAQRTFRVPEIRLDFFD